MKKDSILENNMVQTIGSAGESLAAGAIFTLPAIFIMGSEEGSGISTPSFVYNCINCTIAVVFLGVLIHGTASYMHLL